MESAIEAELPGWDGIPKPCLDERAGRPISIAVWCWLAISLVAAALVRFRLLNVPFERDEGEYAYAGQLILAGVPPYTLLYNMKLPGTYLAYAVSMLLFGQTIAATRLGLIVATTATGVGVFALARRFVEARQAAATAAAYAVLALSTELLGPFGHATHFVALFAVWGLVLLTDALERGGYSRFFAAGILFGISVMMKQPGVVFLACAAAWIIGSRINDKARPTAVLLLGAALPFAALAIWLMATEAAGRFWFWVVQYGAMYASSLSPRDGLSNLRFAASRFLPQAALLWLLAAGGIGTLFAPGTTRQTKVRIWSLLLSSFVGVCPGLYFREHYFLLLLPVIALLVGLVVEQIDSLPRATVWLAPALVVLACLQAIYSQREILLSAPAEQVSRLVYGPDLFPESISIGDQLRSRTRSGDRIVVLGSEPQIYFYAQRRSATGFVYMYPLMERHPWALEMQERMIREVEAARPAYAVLIKTPTSWLERPDSEHRIQDWATPYLAANYTIEGQVVVSEERASYVWDTAAASVPIGEATQALIMRRKDFVSVR